MQKENCAFESALMRRRENLHLKIRKSTKTELLAQKRMDLTQSLNNLDMSIIDRLAQQKEQEFSVNRQEFEFIIQGLAMLSDNKEFFKRLAQTKIYTKLVFALLREESLSAKTVIMEVLAMMAYYSEGLSYDYALKDRTLNRFLIDEFGKYSLLEDDQRLYIKYIVSMIHSLTVSNNPEYCAVLKDHGFCNSLLKRIVQHDVENPDRDLHYFVNKLTKIRKHILRSAYDLNFASECIDYLDLCYSEYSGLCPADYCKLLTEIIYGCSVHQMKQLEDILGVKSSVFAGLESLILEAETNGGKQEFGDEFLISLYQLLEVYNRRMQGSTESILSLIPRYVLFEPLNSSNPDLLASVISFFASCGELYFSFYPELGQELDKLATVCLDAFSKSNELCRDACYVLFHLSKNLYWSRGSSTLIRLGFFNKCSEELQEMDNQCKQFILFTLSSLLEEEPEQVKNYARVIHECGLFQVLEALQDSSCNPVYKAAFDVLACLQVAK